jgi:hypothetical protein
MARVEVKSKGAIFDGRYPGLIDRRLRVWTQGVMRLGRDFARSIAPVLTGTFQRSIRYRTWVRKHRLDAEIYSTDVAGKVRVIEDGFPPRPLKRQPKSGGVRMGKGREGRKVFERTHARLNSLVRSQARLLEVQLAKDLKS